MSVPAKVFSLLITIPLLLSVIAVFNPVSAATVQLDTTFNGLGYRTHHNAGGTAGSDYAYDSIVQPDGKIVVVGESRGTSLAFDMSIWRFNADGSLDTTFNGLGFLTHRITAGSSGYARANAVVQQNDGKYLVAGYSRNGAADQMTLWRINTNGTLDTTFNGTGYVLSATPIPNGSASDLKLQTDGKIVVTGINNSNMTIWRFNIDGSLDTTYNGVGYSEYAGPANSLDQGHALQVQADGKIVVAGLTNGDMALWRYNSNGSADLTFNTTGLFTHHNAAGGNATDMAKALEIQIDGNYVVAGQSWGSASNYYNIAIWRVTSAGLLDSSFNGVGYNTYSGGSTYTDVANSLKMDLAGNILVAGSTGVSSFDSILLRYKADGTLDTDFGGTGYVTHHNAAGGNNTDEAYDVEIQSDGKIVLAGSSVGPTGNGYDMSLWRYEVLNMISGLTELTDVRRVDNGVSLVNHGGYGSNLSVNIIKPITITNPGGTRGGIRDIDHFITQFAIDLSADRNWQNLTVYTSRTQGRSYINYTTMQKRVALSTFSNIPGVLGSNYRLYVPRTQANNGVWVCPFSTMDSGCAGGISIRRNSSATYNGDLINVTPVSKAGLLYWQVSGLSQFVAVTSY